MTYESILYGSAIVIPAIFSLLVYFTGEKVSRFLSLLATLLSAMLFFPLIFERSVFSVNIYLLPSLKGSLAGISGVFSILTILFFFYVYLIIDSDRIDYSLLLLLEAGLLGFYSVRDLFWLFFFWEATLLPLFYMAYRSGARESAIIFLAYTQAAGVLLLAGAVYLWSSSTTTYFGSLGSVRNSMILQILLLGAFWIKTPIFPLHSWLPRLYNDSPLHVILSSIIMVKMGIYGLSFLAYYGLLTPSPALALVAIGGGVYSVLAGYVYSPSALREMAAYLSITHMAIASAPILLYPSPASISAAIVLSIAHSMAMFSVFSSIVGWESKRIGSWPLFTGLVQALPLPGLATFAGELLCVLSALSASGSYALWTGSLIVLASILSIGLLTWVILSYLPPMRKLEANAYVWVQVLNIAVLFIVGVYPRLVEKPFF